MKPLVSVIIVAFRNMDCLRTCLASIGIDPRIEVIVVNNTHQNRGFGAGCNLGASLASSEVLLFLNPDTVASSESILSLAEVVRSNVSIGVVGPALADAEGKIVLSVSEQPTIANFWLVYSFLNKLFYRTTVVRKHWYNHQSPSEVQDVGIVSGAVLAMRKQVFDALGGFDENFFLYWEEVDLARRCLNHGLRIVFRPSIVMRHDGGLSTVQGREKVMVWFRESRYRFAKKYFGGLYAAVVEGWLAMSEHWPLTLVIIGCGLSSNLGGMVLATLVYNEVILYVGKIKAGFLGLILALLGGFVPDVYSLLILAGWAVFDLTKPLVWYRPLFVVAALLGGLCLV